APLGPTPSIGPRPSPAYAPTPQPRHRASLLGWAGCGAPAPPPLGPIARAAANDALTRGAVASDRGVFLDCHGSNVNPERLQKQGFFHDREHGFTSRKRRDWQAFAPHGGENRDDSLFRASTNAHSRAR